MSTQVFKYLFKECLVNLFNIPKYLQFLVFREF